MMLVLLLACAAPEAEDPCEPGENPRLEIGKGDISYAPMATNDCEVELIHGPQGGFHLAISLRAQFLDASEPGIGHLTGEVDGQILAESRPYLNFRCTGSKKSEETWGTQLIYDAAPEALNGKETLIRATVTDAAGTVVTAETTAVIVDPSL